MYNKSTTTKRSDKAGGDIKTLFNILGQTNISKIIKRPCNPSSYKELQSLIR